MKKALVLLSMLGVAALTACGDSNGSSTTTTTPTPTPPVSPMEAEIAVRTTGASALTSGQGNLFLLGTEFVESGGVSANINFVRLEVFTATGQFEERAEIGSGAIISDTGSNRLLANSTREDTWIFLFRAPVKTGRTVTLTVGFTDDFGNDTELSTSFIFTQTAQ